MKAVYPGSFDPLTYGHLDIIKRASLFCGHLYVLALDNSLKTAFFSLSERVEFILAETGRMGADNVSVCAYSGLLTDFMAQNDVNVILRGLRSFSDYEHEVSYATAYRQLNGAFETLLIPCAPEYSYISATMLRDAALRGQDASRLAPPAVINAILNKRGATHRYDS